MPGPSFRPLLTVAGAALLLPGCAPDPGVGSAPVERLPPFASAPEEGWDGDFNGDGYPDRVPRDGSFPERLTVAYGPSGPGRAPAPQPLPLNGDVSTALTGDFNGDGVTDLVVFQDFEEMGRPTQVWIGGPDGLSEAASLPEGATGAVGDFDGDGRADLAFRLVPDGVVEDLVWDHGTVMVVYGDADGLSPTRRTAFTQDTPGVPGESAKGREFGRQLAAADVDGDGYADLAVATLVPDRGGANALPSDVILLRGGPEGLTADGAAAFPSAPG